MPMLRQFCATLGLIALLTACISGPVTPPDAPAQFFFPHGQNGPVLLSGDILVRASSWTRGDGIEFFRITPEGPVYTAGLLSAGYVFDMLCVRDTIYLATDYSLLAVSGWKNGKPFILENHLIAFPRGGVRKMATNGSLLYATAPEGVRSYRIEPDGRLVFQDIVRNAVSPADLISTAHGRQPLIIRSKTSPRSIACFVPQIKNYVTAEEPQRELFPNPVSGLYFSGPELFLQIKGKLIRAAGQTEVFPPEMKLIRAVNRRDRSSFDVIVSDGEQYFHHEIRDGKPGPATPLTGSDWQQGQLAFQGNRIVRSHGAVTIYENGKQTMEIPVVHSEAPVVICGQYVYSIGCHGNTYTLYGFNTKKAQDPDMLPDLIFRWNRIAKQAFRYDIVIPPYAFYNYRDKFLFAPEALLDISDPSGPRIAAAISGTASSIVEDSGKIYLAQGSFLSVLDAEKLPDVEPVAVFRTTPDMKLWTDIAVKGDLLFANGRNKLVIYRMAGGELLKLSATDLPGNSYKMIRINNLLYIAPYGKDTPFRIVDVSDPAKPVIAAELPIHRGAAVLGIKQEHGKLYIADNRTITAYDLKDPLNPVPVNVWCGPDKAMQSYNFMDVRDGILTGKKYPRFDVWRIEK
ncbi:MAG: hypothetical protein J6Q65_06135 [Lentisphaeria bacterium]|nr:hypothetical protein [Lentisphaeria bacterium]